MTPSFSRRSWHFFFELSRGRAQESQIEIYDRKCRHGVRFGWVRLGLREIIEGLWKDFEGFFKDFEGSYEDFRIWRIFEEFLRDFEGFLKDF